MPLKGKKCPRAGITVSTKGGLVGVTTGACGPRNAPEVAIVGMGSVTFRRSELTKLGKRAVAKLEADIARVKAEGRSGNYEATPHGVVSPSSEPASSSSSSYPGAYAADYSHMYGLSAGYGGLGIGDTVRHPLLGTAKVLRLFEKYGTEYADIQRTRDGEVHNGVPVADLVPI